MSKRPKPQSTCAADILQPSGAEKANNILGEISSDEKQLLEACKEGLKGNIQKGIEFVHNPPPK